MSGWLVTEARHTLTGGPPREQAPRNRTTGMLAAGLCTSDAMSQHQHSTDGQTMVAPKMTRAHRCSQDAMVPGNIQPAGHAGHQPLSNRDITVALRRMKVSRDHMTGRPLSTVGLVATVLKDLTVLSIHITGHLWIVPLPADMRG